MPRRPLLVVLLAVPLLAAAGAGTAEDPGAAAATDADCAPRVVEDEYGVERLLDPCEPLPELGSTEGALFTPEGPVPDGALGDWLGTPEARTLADGLGVLALQQPQCDGLDFLAAPWDPQRPDDGSLRAVLEGALATIPDREAALELGAALRQLVAAARPDCTADPDAFARAHGAALDRARAALAALGAP